MSCSAAAAGSNSGCSVVPVGFELRLRNRRVWVVGEAAAVDVV